MAKGKFGKTSKSFKILWPRLSEKFSFAFYVFINSSNFWNQSILGWNLLYLSKESPISNFKGFQYQIWTSEALRVTKIMKQIKFVGAWCELEANSCFQRQSWPKYMRHTLVLVWNSSLWKKFNFNFWTIFC